MLKFFGGSENGAASKTPGWGTGGEESLVEGLLVVELAIPVGPSAASVRLSTNLLWIVSVGVPSALLVVVALADLSVGVPPTVCSLARVKETDAQSKSDKRSKARTILNEWRLCKSDGL